MSSRSAVMFVLLAAIWGSSFMFMRIAAPEFGAIWTAQLRVGLACIVLLAYIFLTKRQYFFRSHWKHFWIAGFFNSGFPFLMFSYAALHIPAGYSAILNAIIPLWAAVFSALLLGERLTWRVAVGSAIAMLGIGLMVRLGPVQLTTETLLGVSACVIATASYGFAGTWIKKHLAAVPGYVNATNSQVFAALSLLPFAAASPAPLQVSSKAWVALLILAVVCSAFAYLMFFKLLSSMPVTQVSSVSFLVPAFGLFWGWVFLNEPITMGTISGFALVLIATALIMGIGPFKRSA